jgi:GTP pyrophosphokinase
MAKTPTDPTAEELILLLDKATEADKKLVRTAFLFAKETHAHQKRFSGEPYFNHLFATALGLAELGLDATTVSAGLLHDTVEDCGVLPEDIEKKFGAEVRFLVEGVTKLGGLKYRGANRHNESLRRLFVATSKDIRVLMIKLVDRRHNMQTLAHVPEEKRERIAKETLSIYAPLADRLGMGVLKRELEDLAFAFVLPEDYARMSSLVTTQSKMQEPLLEEIKKTLSQALVKNGVRGFRSESRVKGLYSLYTKLMRKDGDMDKIYDTLALRIIVSSIDDCYRALGTVHSLWHPLPGKIKDYIAFAKPNGYRSIHTTVMTPLAGPVEVQIRTEEMHREAQYGVASHLSYKEHGSVKDKGEQRNNNLWYTHLIPSLFRSAPLPSPASKKTPAWLAELAEAHLKDDDNERQHTFIQGDFFSHRIFVFTPRGDVVDLPLHSSPIDFAYAIHGDIGNHTAGARVNGKFVSLDTPLHNGDIVEIETKPSAHPSHKWLEYVKTTVARRNISQYLGRDKE